MLSVALNFCYAGRHYAGVIMLNVVMVSVVMLNVVAAIEREKLFMT